MVSFLDHDKGVDTQTKTWATDASACYRIIRRVSC